MSVLELFVLSGALGADLISVAIPIGMVRIRLRIIIRAALVFAVFHIVLILTGYHAGHWLGMLVAQVETYRIYWPPAEAENWANVIGSVILIALGGHMIRGTFVKTGKCAAENHPLQGIALILLALSVSIDALAVGFSMGMMDVDLIKLSIILGTVIFSIAMVGLGLGRRFGHLMGARAELVGGVVLIVLGLHIFWTALF